MNYIEERKIIDQVFRRDIVTIKETGPLTNDRETLDTLTIIRDVIFSLLDQQKIRIVYRGDKNSRIGKKIFGNKYKENDSFTIFSHLYHFGGKADYFFKQTDGTTPVHDILDEYDQPGMEFIFDELSTVLTKKNLNEETVREIERLKYKNIDFYSFFKQPDNRSRFCEAILALKHNDKVRLADYYLYILHVLGKRGATNFTGYVSTSHLYSVAKSFATRVQSRQSGPFIYIYLLDLPILGHGINSDTTRFFDKYSAEALPTLRSIFFKNEKELAIKRALFPHRILAIEDLTTNQVFINPHFIGKPQYIINHYLHHGVPLRQDNFAEEADAYNYRKYVVKHEGIYTNFLLKANR